MPIGEGKTPQPWEIGPHGIISRVAPREETRVHQVDLAYPTREFSSYDFYGGELVCESMTYADQVSLVAGLRTLEVFRNTLRFILQCHDVGQIRGAAQAALVLEDKIEKEQTAICMRIAAEQELAHLARVNELQKLLAAELTEPIDSCYADVEE
jgi:hypothetical protein